MGGLAMTAGKGDRPRPIEIPREDFRKRWDEIFKPKKEEKK